VCAVQFFRLFSHSRYRSSSRLEWMAPGRANYQCHLKVSYIQWIQDTNFVQRGNFAQGGIAGNLEAASALDGAVSGSPAR
jgi:hypothetical protein